MKSQIDYVKITDVSRHGIDKIKKNKNNPDIFYINSWGSGSSSDFSAEYKNGKWVLTMVGQTVS